MTQLSYYAESDPGYFTISFQTLESVKCQNSAAEFL